MVFTMAFDIRCERRAPGLERVKLVPLADRRPGQPSGGQKQRVNLLGPAAEPAV